MTIKCLTRFSSNALHHHVDGGYVHGPHSRRKGNLDQITSTMREADAAISTYVSEPITGSIT